MERIVLDESDEKFKEVKAEWKKKTENINMDNLQGFLMELIDKYTHDYGTIVHAISAGAIATAKAIDRSSQGGITDFQAGCIMWQFIRDWNHGSNKTGLRLIDYDNFLYPQYADKFEKTLGNDTFEALKKEARAHITKADVDYEKYLKDNEQYEIDIASFVVKFPDYYNNKEHYDPLGSGNGDQWKAEEDKKESGFEFAPQKPYCPVDRQSRIYKHWLSIIHGIVPFGYTIKEED